ncbi:MAG: DUF4159 domain-containing protein [Lentisphaerae bacterium]|nr:DUF4159 domain-containing protein [Lentisphaerota bacterium]
MPGPVKKSYSDKNIPILLSLPIGLLSVLCLFLAMNLSPMYARFLEGQTEKFRAIFLNEAFGALLNTSTVLAWVGVVFFFLVFVVTLHSKKYFALSLLRKTWIVSYLGIAFCIFVVSRGTGLILEHTLFIDGAEQDNVTIFLLRLDLLWRPLLIGLFMAFCHIFSWRRRVITLYTGQEQDAPAVGDRFFENLRTHGDDPEFRKSLLGSSFVHLALVIAPFLLSRLTGCVTPYEVPKGDDPVLQLVQIVQPKKPPKKRHVLNPKSAISFYIPDLDDSEIMKEVEQLTQVQHVADPSAVHAAQTTSRKTGWPDGTEKAVFRFIRLEFAGSGWNDGMNPTEASDINFLNEFRKATGFKVAQQSESHPISALAKYPKGFAPPFVFMTGDGNMRISGSEMEVLRRYLMDGSMLFVDCSSPAFDRNFRAFIRALFPGEELKVISDDDPIYQTPFVFPHGAPPLWHHGGRRALGVRRGNRWMVFYHPGDLHDAWKTGHSGVKPEIARQSYQIGVNIVFHAFTHYMDATRKYRK